jgi:hypothetical protein
MNALELSDATKLKHRQKNYGERVDSSLTHSS